MTVVINYWAVLAAGIASFVLGGIWYSPMVFGKAWGRAVGKRMEDIKKPEANKGLASMVVVSLLTSYILAHFIQYMNVTTINGAIQIGIWLWLGFIGTVTSGAVFFEGKPWKWWFIMNGYQLLNVVVMGAILATWK